MNDYSLRDILIVYQGDSGEWETESKVNNYFEIIFIEKGVGNFILNGKKIPYDSEDVFILKQGDAYEFETKKYSKINFLCFTDLLFSSKINVSERKYWLQRIEQIQQHPHKSIEDVISIEVDRKIIWDLQRLVIEELKNERRYYQEIVSNAVSTILSIVVRNISKGYEYTTRNTSLSGGKINQVLSHIHQHAYNNELTKISFLADKFKMSQSSLSITFKKTTGESIHQYVTKYKMKLVEDRLQNTEFTVAQIAGQLGYTDESHLTKTFKKHYSMSPKQYRQEIALQ